MRYRRHLLLLSRAVPALLLSLTLVACGGLNVYPISEDTRLGAELDQEIRNNPVEYPILRNEAVRSYLQGIVDEILRAPEVQYRERFAWKVTVINDDRTINAFATPGGYIYVYTGLLRFLDNESALAGVLAHEIAHAEERHGTEHMTSALGLSTLMGAADVENTSTLTQIAANSASLLATLANSRADELEADEKAFAYLRSTRFWPGGIKFFFDRMILEQGRGSSLFESWLSSHPAPDDRRERVNEMLRESGLQAATPEQLGVTRYRAMLRDLR